MTPASGPTSDQLDALQEMAATGFDRAAAALSGMVGQRVELAITHRHRVTADDPRWFSCGPHLAVVEQRFAGSMGGSSMLVINRESMAMLVNLLGGDALAADELAAGQEAALTETGNILINAVVGSLANHTGEAVDFLLPEFFLCAESELRHAIAARGGELILIRTDFTIRSHSLGGSMALVFNVGAMGRLLHSIDRLIAGR